MRRLPKKQPVVKKSYFQIDTPNGPSAGFTKCAFQLLVVPSATPCICTLIQYLGDKNLAVDFPHGNTKHNPRNYMRTCPSVLRDIEDKSKTEPPSKVYKKEVTVTSAIPMSHLPVLQPRNSKQVENARFKQCGASDCGLFSLAFATTLSQGLDPCEYIFDQSKLRQHLMTCFETKDIVQLPVVKTQKSGKILYDSWSWKCSVYVVYLLMA